MKRSLFTLLLIIVTALTADVYAEEPADISLGKVRMHNLSKLDKNARAEVAAMAAKIKKKRTAGVIKIRGDFPGAESADEYLSKSVFMAREVEQYLKTLLSAKFQVFVTASGYNGAKSAGENSVEIILYPYQLRLEELESLRFVSSQETPLPEPPLPETVVETSPPVETVTEGGLLSPAREEASSSDNASKRESEKRNSEDAALANELVNKAKARAAEKAKRRASGD